MTKLILDPLNIVVRAPHSSSEFDEFGKLSETIVDHLLKNSSFASKIELFLRLNL